MEIDTLFQEIQGRQTTTSEMITWEIRVVTWHEILKDNLFKVKFTGESWSAKIWDFHPCRLTDNNQNITLILLEIERHNFNWPSLFCNIKYPIYSYPMDLMKNGKTGSDFKN